jgi:hypothetical protein
MPTVGVIKVIEEVLLVLVVVKKVAKRHEHPAIVEQKHSYEKSVGRKQDLPKASRLFVQEKYQKAKTRPSEERRVRIALV